MIRSFIFILLCIVLFHSTVCARSTYGRSRIRQQTRPADSYSSAEQYPPQPHNFAYDITDEEGNTRYHKEESDGYRVTGSYGYKDAYGVYRYVDYVADENGYRATIRSNEPGFEPPPPADVTLEVEPPPSVVNLGRPSAARASVRDSRSRRRYASSADSSNYNTYQI